MRQAAAGLMAIMGNVSVPLGRPTPSSASTTPNTGRSADLTNRLYFSELSTSPNVI